MEAGKTNDLIPMADGKTYKRRDDVTENDIQELAKKDYYELAEKVTDGDIARLLGVVETFAAETEMWLRRSEVNQQYLSNGTHGMKRVDGLLKFVEATFASDMYQLLMTRCNVLADAIEEMKRLKAVQMQSSDLLDLYRRVVGDETVSAFFGNGGVG